jgi:hypothetical protein
MMKKADVDDAFKRWRAQVKWQIDSATSKVDRDVWLPAFLSSADNAGQYAAVANPSQWRTL